LEAAAPAGPQPTLAVAGRPVAIPSTGIQTQTLDAPPVVTPSTTTARCTATTKASGGRCSRDAVDGRHCKQHEAAA